jgi:hypothetical protein
MSGTTDSNASVGARSDRVSRQAVIALLECEGT